MTTEELVDLIIARLDAGIPDLSAKVEKWPDDGGNAGKFAHPRAAIWVGYQGSRYGQPETTGSPVQSRVATFDVGVLVRNLNGPHGATAYLDSVRRLLHGYKLPSWGTALVVVEEKFVAHKSGVWRYQMVFSSKGLAVPMQLPEQAPKLTRATFEAAEQGETFEVNKPPPEEP